jgi:primosomal protein N'
MTETLIGVFEIAEMANVSPSAIANWRKRFSDFPAPLAELKSGPVYSESSVKLWLARRAAADSAETVELFYDQLASKRGDPPELREKVEEVLEKLQTEATSTKRPGILLGRVQSGKTRAFLGVIARAFDRGYDAVILTKGTKSLAEQTLSRVKEDFREFIAADQVEVLDILHVPDLTPG